MLIEAEAEIATAELSKLIRDLHSAGLNTEVRKGYDQTLLIFVQAPKDLLGNTVYKSRYVKHQS
jgi:anoctamin-10